MSMAMAMAMAMSTNMLYPAKCFPLNPSTQRLINPSLHDRDHHQPVHLLLFIKQQLRDLPYRYRLSLIPQREPSELRVILELLHTDLSTTTGDT